MRIVGIVILSIFALLLLLCLVPVSVAPRYEKGELTAFVRVLGVRIWSYPARKKTKEETDKAQENEKNEEKERKKLSLDELTSFINPLLSAAGFLLKGISVKNIEITLVAEGYEPDEIGVTAGALWAAFGGFSAFLLNVFRKVTFKTVDVIPDFTHEHGGEEKFSCKIGALAGIIIAALVVFLWQRVKQNSEEKTTEIKTEEAKEKDND